MTWLEGLALVGLAGVLAPVILHFLGRPRPVETVFPAIQFLLRERLPAARVYSLREVVILLLRMVLVAIGVLVVAGPIAPFPLPTCTEKGEVARDLVILLDNSPLGGYLLPEVAGGTVRVFDLYRDLALRAVARMASQYHVSVIPVDHGACPTVTRSRYHNEAAGVLRVGRVGDLGSHRDAYNIAYATAAHPELRRPGLLALTLARLDDWGAHGVLLVQPRPLAGMSAPRNHGFASIDSAVAGSPFGRHEFVCRLASAGGSGTLRVLLENTDMVLDEAKARLDERGEAEVRVGFVPSRAGEERLWLRLLPGDSRLTYDNERRVVFVSPGWPRIEWLRPSARPRFSAAIEAIQSFAGGFGTGEQKAYFAILDGSPAGAAVSDGVAEEVAAGAALVLLVEGLPDGAKDAKGLLPARRTRATHAQEPAEARVRLAALLASRLEAAGVGTGRETVLGKVLAEVAAVPLELRTGAVALAWRGNELLCVMRPYGRGRVVLWNVGDVEKFMARAPGAAVPLLVESLFLASDWRAEIRRGEVGRVFQMPLGFRPGRVEVSLKAPTEDVFRPLFVGHQGSLPPGFTATQAGFWLMSVENPPGEPDVYTIAMDSPPVPTLAEVERLVPPGQALELLGEGDRAHLAGPLCGLFLALAVLEALASNLLYRRVRGGR